MHINELWRSAVRSPTACVFYYHSQMKLWKGNIFTTVCQSFCSKWGLCIPACIGQTHPPLEKCPSPSQTPRSDPPEQTPPFPVHAGMHAPRRSLLLTVRILLECILVLRYISKIICNNIVFHVLLSLLDKRSHFPESHKETVGGSRNP